MVKLTTTSGAIVTQNKDMASVLSRLDTIAQTAGAASS